MAKQSDLKNVSIESSLTPERLKFLTDHAKDLALEDLKKQGVIEEKESVIKEKELTLSDLTSIGEAYGVEDGIYNDTMTAGVGDSCCCCCPCCCSCAVAEVIKEVA